MNLFLPDNFSIGEIKFAEYKSDFELFKSVLDKYFSNYIIENVWEIKTAAIHSANHKIEINIDGEKRNILFRKYNTLQLDQIKFYIEILNKISANFDLVSNVIKTKEGDFMSVVEGNNYALFDFIDGNYFKPDEKSWASAARAVAKMHNVLEDFKKEDIEKIDALSQQGYTYFNKVKNYSTEDFKSIEKIINSKEELTEEDKKALEKIPLYIETVKEIENQKENINKLPLKVIHSDLHPHNFLLKDGEVKAILDFDGMRVSQTARDISFAIYRLGRQFFAQNIMSLSKENCKRLTDIFVENYEKERVISETEKKLLSVLIKDEFIRKTLFVLNGVYKENNNLWKKDLLKFLIAVEEINYFFN